jgi:hypothetical protein
MAEGGGRKRIPSEALLDLRRRLAALPPRHPDRPGLIAQAANLCGLSRATLYRRLQEALRPKPVRRMDRGQPRKIALRELERHCEIIAALKLRTRNQKDRHLSTARAIELLVGEGVETPDGLVRAAPGLLSRTTVNRYLRQWGYDPLHLNRAPAAVRFQARHSNELWQFDLSPSDLKHVEQPLWFEAGRGHPTLMLYGIVDDRSGLAYQEYRCVYGEDVEAALRFLFNAMKAKEEDGLILQGIPEAIYMDNGPIARSQLFQQVMGCLGIRVMTHMPAGSDGRRTTARAKGKVERPFRTVEEAHETLYHFHKPENEAEANLWLHRYLAHYNRQAHRSEPHSRPDDWLQHLPETGIRAMCSWERFCAFAREPERRRIGADAHLTVEGVTYEVDPDLAGESVVLWWGLFDQDLYVEHADRRYGPYRPWGGPIPLHRYRSFKKTKTEERADRIAALAERLGLPRATLAGSEAPSQTAGAARMPEPRAFVDPDPYRELTFANVVAGKLAIARQLGLPLATLPAEDRAFIEALLQETLDQATVLGRVRSHFTKPSPSTRPAC